MREGQGVWRGDSQRSGEIRRTVTPSGSGPWRSSETPSERTGHLVDLFSPDEGEGREVGRERPGPPPSRTRTDPGPHSVVAVVVDGRPFRRVRWFSVRDLSLTLPCPPGTETLGVRIVSRGRPRTVSRAVLGSSKVVRRRRCPRESDFSPRLRLPRVSLLSK